VKLSHAVATRTVVNPLEGEEADKLEKAVESATIELVTGSDDCLLRRLSRPPRTRCR